MTFTKLQLIQRLKDLDVSDDAIVVLRRGMGYEDLIDVDIQEIFPTMDVLKKQSAIVIQ